MRHLFWVTRLFFYYFCDIFVRKKKNRSGSTSVIVVEKNSNKYKEHITIGISSDENEIEGLVEQGKEWIRKYQSRHSPELAFRIAKSKIEVRPMFHFTRKRIEAHICICFVALKVYKELERTLKLNNISMSVDKVLRMAKTITTLQVRLPLNNEVISKVMIMKRHKAIEKLFDEEFWGTQ